MEVMFVSPVIVVVILSVLVVAAFGLHIGQALKTRHAIRREVSEFEDQFRKYSDKGEFF